MKTNTSKNQDWRFAARILLIVGLLMSCSLGSAPAVSPDPQQVPTSDRGTFFTYSTLSRVEPHQDSTPNIDTGSQYGTLPNVESQQAPASNRNTGAQYGTSPSNVPGNPLRSVRDSICSFFLREGPGLPTYDLYPMRGRYVPPQPQSTSVWHSTNSVLPSVQWKDTDMDEKFLKLLTSSQSSPKEQVNPDQGASTSSEAQARQDQSASLGQFYTEADKEHKKWVEEMSKSLIEMHEAMKANGSIEPLPQSSQAQSQETPTDQMRRLLGLPPVSTTPRRQMRQELQPAEAQEQACPAPAYPPGGGGIDGGGGRGPLLPKLKMPGGSSGTASRSSSYSSLASFTSQLPNREYLKRKAAALCRACAKDLGIKLVQEAIADTAAQLQNDPDNAELKETLKELLSCLDNNRLYKELKKLEAVAIALREEARQQGEQAKVDAIDEDIFNPLKEILGEPSTTLEEIAKGSDKDIVGLADQTEDQPQEGDQSTEESPTQEEEGEKPSGGKEESSELEKPTEEQPQEGEQSTEEPATQEQEAEKPSGDKMAPEQSGNESYSPSHGFTINVCTIDNLQTRQAQLTQEYEKDIPFKNLVAERAIARTQLKQNPNYEALQSQFQDLDKQVRSHPLGKKIIQLGMDAQATRQEAALRDLGCRSNTSGDPHKIRQESKEHQAKEKASKEVVDNVRELLGNLPGTPSLWTQATEGVKGVVKSLNSPEKAIIGGLVTAVGDGIKYVFTGKYESGPTTEEAQKVEKVHDRVFDADNYHRSEAEQGGYAIGEMAKFVSFFWNWRNAPQVGPQLGVVKTLQKGGHTLSSATLRALNLTKEQGRNAIHALKKAKDLPKTFHGTIMSNGDYLHPHTGEILGNIRHYL